MPMWKEESEDKMSRNEKSDAQKVHNTNPIQREMDVRGKKFVMDDLSWTGMFGRSLTAKTELHSFNHVYRKERSGEMPCQAQRGEESRPWGI
jgi:hypothetical protein